jgi:hypothetical protein
VLASVFAVALLGATVVAFALTEGAKLENSPIYQTRVTKLISPRCACSTAKAVIHFRLRGPNIVTAWIIQGKKRVATLTSSRYYRAGPVNLVFTGISSAELPDGRYYPVIHLVRKHWTITLPNPITIDTKPPVVRVHRAIHADISPGVPGHDLFRVDYRLSKPAHAILLVDGTQVEYTNKEPLTGVLSWDGEIHGRQLHAGAYGLEVSAQDLAGNRAKPFAFATVAVRYVSLGRSRIVVRRGARFAVLALTAAPRVVWVLHGGRGVLPHGTLHLRAPKRRGVYHLYVEAAGHTASSTVIVR